MSDRLDTIKRLAETDDYWAAYADGLFDKRNILREPTWDRAVDQVADRSEYRTVEETRERLHRKRHTPT